MATEQNQNQPRLGYSGRRPHRKFGVNTRKSYASSRGKAGNTVSFVHTKTTNNKWVRSNNDETKKTASESKSVVTAEIDSVSQQKLSPNDASSAATSSSELSRTPVSSETIQNKQTKFGTHAWKRANDADSNQTEPVVQTRKDDVKSLTNTKPPAAKTEHDPTGNVQLKYSRRVMSKPKPRRRRSPPKHAAPKRIKVSAATTTTTTTTTELKEDNEEARVENEWRDDDDDDKPEIEEAESDGKSNRSESPCKKLTDFAYRETKNARRRRGRHVTTNRGLVRVQPKAAPICSTFLRGIACTNESCMKRHDIPKEYAMPVCSFFQRQGMCFKENCRFRHVKVNPRATPCPSFELLGFCDVPHCNMMHQRSNKKPSQRTYLRPSKR